jgi:O-antigen biosynthesis protein
LGKYPDLAIVIVSYGSAEWLDGCLGTLVKDVADYIAQSNHSAKVETALVENKPDAHAQSQLLAEKYSIKFLPSPVNLGFGGGTNFGWQNLNGEVYIVLNPDMTFPMGWLAKLIAPFAKDSQIGIVGCKLLDQAGKIQHAGGILKYGAQLGEHFGAGEPDDGRFDIGGYVDFVTGAALAIPKKVLAEVGGFDEAYFPGYYEDVDLGWRVRQAGWKVWYEPSAVAYHYEGGSFGRGENYYRAFHRNRLRFALKNLPAHRLFREFLIAEKERLRYLPYNQDRRATEAVYSGVKAHFIKKLLNLNQKRADKTNMNDYNLEPEAENQTSARISERLTEVKNSWLVEEKPFRSKIPFVANWRERFNSISTKWYVKPLLQQQNDFNAATTRAIEEIGQVVMSRQAEQDLTVSVLSGKIEQLEMRLSRIEQLLEKLVQEK